MSAALSANQAGLVPGFALQDGDKLVRLATTKSVAGNTDNLLGVGANTVAGAYQLRADITFITAATAAANSFKLANLPVGGSMRLYNTTAVAAQIFPFNPTSSIDGKVAGAPTTLPAGAAADFLRKDAFDWVTRVLGAPLA